MVGVSGGLARVQGGVVNTGAGVVNFGGTVDSGDTENVESLMESNSSRMKIQVSFTSSAHIFGEHL